MNPKPDITSEAWHQALYPQQLKHFWIAPKLSVAEEIKAGEEIERVGWGRLWRHFIIRLFQYPNGRWFVGIFTFGPLITGLLALALWPLLSADESWKSLLQLMMLAGGSHVGILLGTVAIAITGYPALLRSCLWRYRCDQKWRPLCETLCILFPGNAEDRGGAQ